MRILTNNKIISSYLTVNEEQTSFPKANMINKYLI